MSPLRHADLVATAHTALGGSGQVKRLGPLRERFIVPPFTVLDARQGDWQKRKRGWLNLGIQSELGRGAQLTMHPDPEPRLTEAGLNYYRKRNGTPEKRALNGGASESTPTDRYGPRPSASGRNTRPGRNGKDEYKGGDAWLGSGGRFNQKPLGDTFDPDYTGQPSTLGTLYKEKASSGGRLRDYAKAEAYDESGRSTSSGPSQLRTQYRQADATPGGGGPNAAWRNGGAKASGQAPINTVFARDEEAGDVASQTGTSIFDPVLCELMYRWFCPHGGTVIDPFAGGSVRGVVAALLGLGYVGIELRPEQTVANYQQKADICPDSRLVWLTGDARDLKQYTGKAKFDFILTCPPYYNLELYSYDERDLSNAPTYEDFLASYQQIIADSVDVLKDDRFACVVVGNMRDKTGNYLDFVGDTIRAFEAAGARLYNEAILITAVGSLPIRLNNQFLSGLKLGRSHQNVLLFCKGDWRKAADRVDIAVAKEGK